MNFVNTYSFKKENIDGIITVSFINIYDAENFDILGSPVYCL